MKTKLIPFNLELAKDYKNIVGIKTTEGIDVEIITFDGRDKTYPILGYIGNKDTVFSWTNNGKLHKNIGHYDADLMLEIKDNEKITYQFIYQHPKTHILETSNGIGNFEDLNYLSLEFKNILFFIKTTWDNNTLISYELINKNDYEKYFIGDRE